MRKVRMYTTYTESHGEMFERFFLPSVPDSLELISERFEQECPTGEYHSTGWVRAVGRKIEVIRRAIDLARRDGDDYFMFSDCDIHFFSDIEPDITRRMKNFDFIAMDDDIYCTGFMAIRADDRAAFMWRWAAENLQAYGCDQPAGNAFIRKHERWIRLADFVPPAFRPGAFGRHAQAGAMRFGKLPRIEYFNFMHLGEDPSIWDGRTPVDITPDQLSQMRMMHANYTRGIANKIRLLEIICGMKLANDRAAPARLAGVV